MTNLDKYDDLFDSQEKESLVEMVGALDNLHARTARYRLPLATCSTIEAVVDKPPAAAPRPISTARIAWGGRFLWRWPALAAAILAVAGVLTISLIPRSAAAVSADTVLKRAAAFSVSHGHYMTFLYRQRVTYGPGRRGFGTSCGGRPRSTVTTYTRLWLRGPTQGVPQTVIENANLGCAPCPSTVVGRISYNYLYRCGAPMLIFGPYMESANWANLGLASNLLYGVSTARRLQHSPKYQGISVQRGALDGNPVFILEVTNWPGDPRAHITFYFDAETYVLRGIDYRSGYTSFPENGVQRIRLLKQRYIASPRSWTKATKVLPPYSPPAEQNRFHVGADLIGMDLEPTIHQMRAVCPKVANLASLLHSGKEPLQSCREAYPHMTASFLAWRLMEGAVKRLKTAERAGIFGQPQVRASIIYEHNKLSLWVTYKNSLRYS